MNITGVIEINQNNALLQSVISDQGRFTCPLAGMSPADGKYHILGSLVRLPSGMLCLSLLKAGKVSQNAPFMVTASGVSDVVQKVTGLQVPLKGYFQGTLLAITSQIITVDCPFEDIEGESDNNGYFVVNPPHQSGENEPPSAPPIVPVHPSATTPLTPRIQFDASPIKPEVKEVNPAPAVSPNEQKAVPVVEFVFLEERGIPNINGGHPVLAPSPKDLKVKKSPVKKSDDVNNANPGVKEKMTDSTGMEY